MPALAVVLDFATAKAVHIPEYTMVLRLEYNQTSSYNSCIAHYFPHCIAPATEAPLQEIGKTRHSEESVASIAKDTARDTAEEDIARYRCCTAVGNSLPLYEYRRGMYGWEGRPDIMEISSDLPWRQKYATRFSGE